MGSKYVQIYAEIAQAVGDENAEKLFRMFRGQQITFPQRLYSNAYVSQYVKENYNGKNIRELSRKFEYTERRVRQFLKDGIKIEGENIRKNNIKINNE